MIILVTFRGHFGALWSHFRSMVAPWGPKGAQGSRKSDFGHILGSFWEPRGALFGSFWHTVSKSEGLCRLVGALFPVSENGTNTGLPMGGGHAIRPRRRMFREGRPSSLRLHFGLHFGVILGANFATMLFLGRHGGQNRLRKERLKGACFLEPDRPRIRVSESYISHTCARRSRVPSPTGGGQQEGERRKQHIPHAW